MSTIFFVFFFNWFTFCWFGGRDDVDDVVAVDDVEPMCDGNLPKKSETSDEAVLFDRWLDWDDRLVERFEAFKWRRAILIIIFNENPMNDTLTHRLQNMIVFDWKSNRNWCTNYQRSVLSWFIGLKTNTCIATFCCDEIVYCFLFDSFLSSEDRSNARQYGNAFYSGTHTLCFSSAFVYIRRSWKENFVASHTNAIENGSWGWALNRTHSYVFGLHWVQ